MTSHLRKVLENRAGLEKIYIRLPYVFLPPRFEKISRNRDLILLFDDNFTLHVRWSGELEFIHHPLTRKAAFRLVRDVQQRMTRFRRDLDITHRFLNSYAEDVGEGLRSRELTRWDKREKPVELRTEKEEGESLSDLLRFIGEGNG